MRLLLAQNNNLNDVWGGSITPPANLNFCSGNASNCIGKLLGTGLELFILFASIALLAFLLWGALDWIMSGGDKDKITKAQQKITNAIIGFLVIIVGMAIFGLITGDILGIVSRGPDGSWQFILPTLGGTGTPSP